jgi:hypothetical protein
MENKNWNFSYLVLLIMFAVQLSSWNLFSVGLSKLVHDITTTQNGESKEHCTHSSAASEVCKYDCCVQADNWVLLGSATLRGVIFGFIIGGVLGLLWGGFGGAFFLRQGMLSGIWTIGAFGAIAGLILGIILYGANSIFDILFPALR